MFKAFFLFELFIVIFHASNAQIQNNSSNDLETDWKNFEICSNNTFKDEDLSEKKLKEAFHKCTPNDIYDFAKEMNTNYTNNYSQQVNENINEIFHKTAIEFALAQKHENVRCFNEMTQTTEPDIQELFNETVNKFEEEFKDELNNISSEIVKKLRDEFYSKDNDFDDFYNKNKNVFDKISKFVIRDKLETFVQNSFSKGGNYTSECENAQEELNSYTKPIQEVNNDECLIPLKSEFIKWALTVFMEKSLEESCQNKPYLNINPNNSFMLFKLNEQNTVYEEKCNIKMTEQMENDSNIYFRFPDECELEESQYHLGAKVQVQGYTTRYNKTFIFNSISINLRNEESIKGNGNNFKDFKDQTIVPNKVIITPSNGNVLIEYSFNSNDFQIESISEKQLQEKLHNNLTLIIYKDKQISFAKQSCLYVGDSTGSLLEDWNHFQKIILNVEEIENSFLEIYKLYDKTNIGMNLLKFYENKNAYFSNKMKEDIVTLYYTNTINSNISIDCENQVFNLNTDLLTNLSDLTEEKYKDEVDKLIPEGKEYLFETIYYKDNNFERTYSEQQMETLITPFTRSIFKYRIKTIIEKTFKETQINEDLKENCSFAMEELKSQNGETIKIEVKEEENDCFTFIKEPFINWAPSVALKINNLNKNEQNCIFTYDTIFSLIKDNNSLCNISFSSDMLYNNILYVNFNNRDCNLESPPSKYTFSSESLIQGFVSKYRKQFIYSTQLESSDSGIITNGVDIIKDFKSTCTIPNILFFSSKFINENIDYNSSLPTYIEYSFGNDYTFEQMNSKHILRNQGSDNLNIIIYNNKKILFSANKCTYLQGCQEWEIYNETSKQCEALNDCSKCKNNAGCVIKKSNVFCRCKGGYYGETCELKSTQPSKEIFKDKFSEFLGDDNLIIDYDNIKPIKIDNSKQTMQELIEITSDIKENEVDNKLLQQINTLNSITENYLSNSKYHDNSVHLLTLAVKCNILKLKSLKTNPNLRNLQNTSESVIIKTIEHLIHLGATHSSKNIINNSTSSYLTTSNGYIYIHQWRDSSAHDGKEKAYEQHLTFLDPMTLNCNQNSNLQYTIVELIQENVKEIFDDTYSNILSFHVVDTSSDSISNNILGCSSVKFKIPLNDVDIVKNSTNIGNGTLYIYDRNNQFFTDKCYRGNFDFDITQRIKEEIMENVSYANSLSEECHCDGIDDGTATLICPIEDATLVGFYVGPFKNATALESGSLFECSTDIQDIEKNIAFWIYFILVFLAIVGIVTYLLLKYKTDHKDIMNIEKALTFDDLYYDIMQGRQIENNTERTKTNRNENFSLNQKDIVIAVKQNVSYGSILGHNFCELHPLINLFFPSLITPLSMRIAFFVFNFLTLFGFNAVFFTNDYLYDRYKDEDRDKFVFAVKEEFGKMISAIVCSMGLAVIMRLIVLVSINKKEILKKDISIDRDKGIEDFRRKMIMNRTICVFVMMIIIGWFFYFSIAWCNRYPKAQHSWGDSCAWSLMFNYILFSSVYIMIISGIETNPSCESCVYYMKRLFMF